MNKKNILVIGSSGFIGKWLVASLLESNMNTFSFSPEKLNIKNKILYNRLVHIQGDINNIKSLTKAFEIAKPSIVVSLAAYGGKGEGLLKAAEQNPIKALDVNVIGFYNLLNISSQFKIKRLIWSSSTVVYGKVENYKEKIVTELSVRTPNTTYGLTKILAEDIAYWFNYNHKLNITGLRLPLVVGPGLDYKGVAASISELAKASANNISFTGDMPSGAIDITYVKDVANIFLQLIKTNKKLKLIYNIPTIRTSSKLLVKYFKKHIVGKTISNIKLKESTVYPLMSDKTLKDDMKVFLEYDLSNLISDWINELRKVKNEPKNN